MQDFVDMAEAHAWTLQRLREMAGRLTEQAYLRASAAGAEGAAEDAQRWMLVFDRMARGLRLTMALEAKLSRERRSDADSLLHEAEDERPSPRRRTSAASPRAEAEPLECDRERDDDALPPGAPLGERIERLAAIIAGVGDPSPPARLHKSEQRALAAQRAARARLAATALPPDEPWDAPAAGERTEAEAAEWRGSG